MMLEVEVAGRLHRVSIDPVGPVEAGGGRFRIAVHAPGEAAEVVVVDARRTDLGLSTIDCDTGRVTDAAVTGGPGGEHLVQLARRDVRTVIDGHRFARRRPGGGSTGGELRVTAPMPGRVLRVLVEPGELVDAGRGLVVVEAMKMENALIAPARGRVREITVVEGTSVEAGRLLVWLDPVDSSEPSDDRPRLR